MKPKQTIRQKEAYHHGDLRQQLLHAAWKLIAESGVDRFKVADACRLAGVSIAAPYRHFENRDDLLDQIVLQAMVRMKDELTAAISDLPRGSLEALAALGVGYVEFARREPNIFRLMFRAVDDDERHQRLENCGRETYGVLLTEVATSLHKDSIDEQVLQLALPMWTFVHGTAVLLIDDMLHVADVDVDIKIMVSSVCHQLMGGTKT